MYVYVYSHVTISMYVYMYSMLYIIILHTRIPWHTHKQCGKSSDAHILCACAKWFVTNKRVPSDSWQTMWFVTNNVCVRWQCVRQTTICMYVHMYSVLHIVTREVYTRECTLARFTLSVNSQVLRQVTCVCQVDRKKPPPLGGFSYLLCSLIKNRV